MIDNRLPSLGFKDLYLFLKDQQDIFPGGVLTNFTLPVRSPFCVLEVPRKSNIVEQNLSGFWQLIRFDCAIQIGFEHRDLWESMLLCLDTNAVLKDRMTRLTDSNIGEFRFLETEYFIFDKHLKNNAILFGSRLHFTMDLELSISNPESAYETLRLRLLEFNKNSVITTEDIPIGESEDE